MKNKIYLLLIISAIIASCSKDSNDPSNEIDLLAQKNPWTFSHYKSLTINNDGGSGYNHLQIENFVAKDHNSTTLRFNINGTGFTFSMGGTANWNWRIVGNDILISEFGGTKEGSLFKNFKVSSNELSFDMVESENDYYDNNGVYTVIHSGRFFFK